MKRCPKCDAEKPFDAFAKNKNTSDGLQCWCRVCCAASRRSWVERNPEKAKLAGSAWAKEHPEKNRTRANQWRKDNAGRAATRDAEYRRENAEALAAASAAWRARNLERMAERRKEYRANNTEQVREKSNLWKRLNRGKVLANVKARKFRKRRATPAWLSREQLKAIQDYYISADALSMLTGEQHCVDHVVPLLGKIVSGLHVPWNLQILTEKENLLKSNKFYN